MGSDIPIVVAGEPYAVSGTSVTAPAMAGLVAQLNAAIRATPGFEKKTIGFMNPFLYWAAEKYKDAFIDIKVGSSFSGGTSGTHLLEQSLTILIVTLI